MSEVLGDGLIPGAFDVDALRAQMKAQDERLFALCDKQSKAIDDLLVIVNNLARHRDTLLAACKALLPFTERNYSFARGEAVRQAEAAIAAAEGKA